MGEQCSGGHWEKEKPKVLRSLPGWTLWGKMGELSESKSRVPQPGSCGQASLICSKGSAGLSLLTKAYPQPEKAWGYWHYMASSGHQEPWHAHYSKDQVPEAHVKACPGLRNGIGITTPNTSLVESDKISYLVGQETQLLAFNHPQIETSPP